VTLTTHCPVPLRPETGLTLRVRYFAGARSAAGLAEEELRLSPGATVAEALTALRERHGEPLRRVLAGCSFLLDGVAVRELDTTVPPTAELDVLPPFAGG
jgi:molybdopterin synthase sulfur carrier subunit